MKPTNKNIRNARKGQNQPSRNLHLLSRLGLMALVVGMVFCVPTSAVASPGSEEDAATIKASNDPIYQVRVIKLYDPEGKMGEVQVSIENTLRGDDSMTGKFVDISWDNDYPQKNQNWVVMVSQGEDGVMHVHPEIRYDVSNESISEEGKASWIQMKVLQ